MNETKVEVLRDSGCSVIVVKSALVSPFEFTGAYRQLILIDNSKLIVPTARCFVKSPFFTGLTEVICIEHPVCDLIIGNVDGVHPYEKTAQVMSKVEESQLTSDCTEVIDETMMCHATLVITEPVVVAQSVEVKPDEVTTVIPTFYKSVKITPDESQTGGAAVTRSQTRKPERTIKPLRVSSQVKINVTKDKFQEAQINNKNLSIFCDKADVYFPEADRNPLTSIRSAYKSAGPSTWSGPVYMVRRWVASNLCVKKENCQDKALGPSKKPSPGQLPLCPVLSSSLHGDIIASTLSSIFNLQSLIPEKGVSRIGYTFGHNCKSIV